jgi:hypothetical protein
MALKDVVGDLAGAALQYANELRERAGREVARKLRFNDTNREVAISDTFVATVLQGVAGRDGSLTIVPSRDGYDVRVRARTGPVTAYVIPTALSLRAGALELAVRTPEPPVIERRWLATWIVGVVVKRFGGTKLARILLSRGMPSSIWWDGARAICSLKLGARIPDVLRAAPDVDARLTREHGWLRVSVENEARYAALKTHLAAYALSVAFDAGRAAFSRSREC